MIVDNREQPSLNPYGYVVATDSFMSGWGKAPGRSVLAVEVNTDEEYVKVVSNMERRSDMKRVRYARVIRNITVQSDDHLEIVDKVYSPSWFK